MTADAYLIAKAIADAAKRLEPQIVECRACNGGGRDVYKMNAICEGCRGAGKHRL